MADLRRTAVVMVVAASAVALAPPVSAARPDASLRGLVLSGECFGQGSELKNVAVIPRSRFLFAPLRLLDPEYSPTRKWLMPVTIVASGEGLKSRHLIPGVTYTRPGRGPDKPLATCEFHGKTEDGDIHIMVNGIVRPS